MNLTVRWAEFLTKGGYAAEHWSTQGPSGASDATICAFARAHDWIVMSNDLDYPQILAHTSCLKPSVIVLRGEPLTPEVCGHVVVNAIQDCEDKLIAGAVLSLDWSDRPRVPYCRLLSDGEAG